MFGKSMDLGTKKDFNDAFIFYVVHLAILVGFSTVLFHVLGAAGIVSNVGDFFAGGKIHTIVGSLFILWLGGSILARRGMTGDMMSVIILMAGLYLAWTSSVILGLVPIALLTTMGGNK